jgi:hypothetical protein
MEEVGAEGVVAVFVAGEDEDEDEDAAASPSTDVL